MANLYPQPITDAELVAAERRHHRIKKAQVDTYGPDGHRVPGWVPIILQRMDAMEERWQRMEERWHRMERQWQRMERQWQRHEDRMERQWQRHENRMEKRWQRQERQWQRHENRIEQRLETMSREIRRESQRAMNRSIRTNAEALEPVLRTEDGQVPENFPATMRDFRSARGPQIDALLQFYNLARAKGLAERKASLQRHLGLNL